MFTEEVENNHYLTYENELAEKEVNNNFLVEKKEKSPSKTKLKFNNMFNKMKSKVKNYFDKRNQKRKMSEEDILIGMAKLVDPLQNLEVMSIKTGEVGIKTWSIKNCSSKIWPMSVIMKSVNKEIMVDPTPFTIILTPGAIVDLQLPIEIPPRIAEVKTNKQNMLLGVFCLFDLDTFQEFGEHMKCLIEVIPEEVNIGKEVIRDSLVDQETLLYANAMAMEEHEHGEFEECLEMLRLTKGDENIAIELLKKR